MAGGPRAWVRAATLAPSTHNTQPWKFAIGGGFIQLFADLKRALYTVDPEHRELYISLGCALENLCLAAQRDGFSSEVELFPDDLRHCAARVEFSPDAISVSPLADVIERRQTNRRHYDMRPLDPETIQGLDAVECDPGVTAQLILDRSRFCPYYALVEDADRRQLATPQYVPELLEWVRFTPKESTHTRDGLSAAAYDRPPVSRWLGERLVRRELKPDQQAQRDIDLLASASALLVLSSETDDRAAWLSVGRTLERLELAATRLGLQHAYANQLCQVPEVRTQLVPRLGPRANYPQVVLRLGYAPPAPRSLRRPIEEVLIEMEPMPERRSRPSIDDQVAFYP